MYMGYEKTSWHSGEVSSSSNVLCLLWRRDISRWTSFYFHHGITLQALSGYYDLVAFFWWYVCIGPKANKSWELLGVKKYMNGILENCIYMCALFSSFGQLLRKYFFFFRTQFLSKYSQSRACENVNIYGNVLGKLFTVLWPKPGWVTVSIE